MMTYQQFQSTTDEGRVGWKIYFDAEVRNRLDQAVEDTNLHIQFFDTHDETWTNWLTDLALDDGVLTGLYIMDFDNKNSSAVGRKTFDIIANGGFPHVRLVVSTTVTSTFPHVIAESGRMTMDSSPAVQEIRLDFGSKWWLEPNEIKRPLNGGTTPFALATAGVPRPEGSHPLYNALLAAVNNPGAFDGYELDVDEIVVQPIGTPAGIDPLIVDSLQSQIANQQSSITALNIELGAKAALIAAKEVDITTLTADVAAKSTQIQGLEAQVAAVSRTAAPANEVYTKLVEEVESASDALVDSPFVLSNISLNLKTHVVNDAGVIKLQLVDALAAETSQNNAISELTVQIGSKDPTTLATPELVATPGMIGLTETPARHRLAAQGLKMKAVYHATQNQVVGQAFKQNPLPGDDIKAGDTVTVIFAKENQNPY